MVLLQRELSDLMLAGLIGGAVGALLIFILLHIVAMRTNFYRNVYRRFIPVKKLLYYVFFFSISLFLSFITFYLVASAFGLLAGR